MEPAPRYWAGLLREQAGVISRAQAIAAGLTRHAITARLDSGRWQPIYRGVYAAFTGPLPRQAMLWAAVLTAGPDAVLSYQTAAELYGLASPPAAMLIHVTVPTGQRVAPIRRVVLHYSGRLEVARHPALRPPRTRLEETVVDLAESASTVSDAISWILTACGSRRTTPERLQQAMEIRSRLRRRRELLAAVADARSGVHSLLEHGYLYRVERPHGLPRGIRQRRSRGSGGTTYDDVYYEPFGLLVELDGRSAHPEEQRWRDNHRDNAGVVAGLTTLRFSYPDVMERPCRTAAVVGQVLSRAGYAGGLRRCGPCCSALGRDGPG